MAAALILGAIWWAWHLPTFFIATLSQSHLSIPVFLINSLALSVIMTWLYQRTRGDLLLMILVHAAANATAEMGVSFTAEVIAEVACAAVIVASGGFPFETRLGTAHDAIYPCRQWDPSLDHASDSEARQTVATERP